MDTLSESSMRPRFARLLDEFRIWRLWILLC